MKLVAQRSIATIAPVIALLWLLIGAFLFYHYVDLGRDRIETETRAKERAASLALLVAQHGLGTFERTVMALRRANDQVRDSDLRTDSPLSPARRAELDAALERLLGRGREVDVGHAAAAHLLEQLVSAEHPDHAVRSTRNPSELQAPRSAP